MQCSVNTRANLKKLNLGTVRREATSKLFSTFPRSFFLLYYMSCSHSLQSCFSIAKVELQKWYIRVFNPSLRSVYSTDYLFEFSPEKLFA